MSPAIHHLAKGPSSFEATQRVKDVLVQPLPLCLGSYHGTVEDLSIITGREICSVLLSAAAIASEEGLDSVGAGEKE